MKRPLCIWLPNWPIQRLRSELQHVATRSATQTDSDACGGSPIVLWSEDARRGRLIVACCQLARELGVRTSMKLAEAADMIRFQSSGNSQSSGTSQSQTLIERHDRDLDQQALEQLAASVQRQITPHVALEVLGKKPWAGHPRHQCESLLCETAGVCHLFGDESGMLRAVETLLAGRGLRARMAIADSAAAAWALAHEAKIRSTTLADDKSGVEREFAGKSEACDSLPDLFQGGLTVSGATETRRLVGHLPVQSLRIDPATVSTLARLGVTSVSQLLSLPRSGLAIRLGRGLVHRMEQVLGEVDEPLEVHQTEAEYAAALTLEYPTTDLVILVDRIEKLTGKLTSSLLTRQRGALRLTCSLTLSGQPLMNLDVGLFAPTVDIDHLSGLIINQLESKRIHATVERLSLLVTLSGPLRNSQASLFQLNENQRSDAGMHGVAISRLVDSLSGRLGRDRVGCLEIQNDPLPERAYHVLPLAGNAVSPVLKRIRKSRNQLLARSRQGKESATTLAASVQPSEDDALRRPLSLLTEPIPLRVAWSEAVFSLRVSSPRLPRRIRLCGVDLLVLNHWGPERIESGWWRGQSIRRDYYRIETDSGEWWWIFRNLVTRAERENSRTPYQWMLHGRFS